jgi:hypothetical protein
MTGPAEATEYAFLAACADADGVVGRDLAVVALLLDHLGAAGLPAGHVRRPQNQIARDLGRNRAAIQKSVKKLRSLGLLLLVEMPPGGDRPDIPALLAIPLDKLVCEPGQRPRLAGVVRAWRGFTRPKRQPLPPALRPPGGDDARP